MDIVFCVPCDRHFNDRDDTGVCPFGHETRTVAADDDSDYPLGQVQI